ncbi:AAA family ATPase [Algisphaera agarilytica]|uniref:MoxR-like ATPase n=1 Tax=Algisphaera agarilytica TaxID=1385975 RepID=A0A7X0LJN4_9BACT|nr:MoxR family ATPase [Algisphaera agarilytica]MBB6429555.1 MoxR-like ATPase [Algisphaera agarilytica]
MNQPYPPLPADDLQLLQQAGDTYARLKDEIGKVIVGQDDIVTALLAAIFAEGHALLVGVPGLAKTLLVKTLAEVLAWDFNRIQFTPDMMPADIIGMELLQEQADGKRGMNFVPGPIFANIILADEINRTPPKTQSALLEAMQERQVTSMGHRHVLEPPFVVVATQNPIEQEGTYPLPEAQLDRFMLSLYLDYPDVEQEEQIVMETTAGPRTAASPMPTGGFITKDQFIAMQALVRRLPASQHIVSYAVALARATRPNSAAASEVAQQYVEWGAGPRAGQHMVLIGKALALMHGQPAVTAEHIRQAAPHVLRHRILPNFQAAGEGITAGDIVERIVSEISEPSYA